MTNKQLINILQQYPSDLDIVLRDAVSGELKRCNMVNFITVCDLGISQEYIFLSCNAAPISPVCVAE